MKKVMCFGTFDILHPGHLSYFEQALCFGDYLIVVVARDKVSEKLKGRKPRNKERKRLLKVRKVVDRAVLGYVKDRFKVIEKYKPDVICFGYDQKVSSDLMKRIKKAKIKIKKAKSYKPRKYKSHLMG